MHKIEIRLTNEGQEPECNFEVYSETLKDNVYVEMAPMREIASGGSPVVMFLEDNERVIVVAKGNAYRMIYDKDQNANVRVPTEEEAERQKQREAMLEKSKVDQDVRTAQGEVSDVQAANDKAAVAAEANLKKAQTNAAPKPAAPAATVSSSPVDSKQVKKDA